MPSPALDLSPLSLVRLADRLEDIAPDPACQRDDQAITLAMEALRALATERERPAPAPVGIHLLALSVLECAAVWAQPTVTWEKERSSQLREAVERWEHAGRPATDTPTPPPLRDDERDEARVAANSADAELGRLTREEP